MKSLDPSLSETVDFNLLDSELAKDLRSSLQFALANQAVLTEGSDPLSLFRGTVAAAIGKIQNDGRVSLFLRFLENGPYEGNGRIPEKLREKRLTDTESSTVVAFIYSHMVNCFKGALTEILALAPCLRILQEVKEENSSMSDARLYVGDAVWAKQLNRENFSKSADLHFITEQSPSIAVVHGVVEVKSYFCTPRSLKLQLDKHLSRAKRGLRIGGNVYSRKEVVIDNARRKLPVRITVLPSKWRFPRSFHFEEIEGRKLLHVDYFGPALHDHEVRKLSPTEWRITLRWSKEALEASAYEMTYWFMEKLGEVLYSQKGVPGSWKDMTPADAGRNAAKMMMYYAIRRCRGSREQQRAIALYNSYGFGYALGMNFRDSKGKRRMLWPEDLNEILAKGRTKKGYKIV